MKIKLYYTDGSTITAKGYKAKALLRRELRGTGFGLNDVVALQRGEWRYIDARLPDKTHDDGTTLSCLRVAAREGLRPGSRLLRRKLGSSLGPVFGPGQVKKGGNMK